MKDNSGKEKMLKHIRNALSSVNYNIPALKEVSPYRDKKDDISIIFAENFSKANGKFVYCSNEEDFQVKIKILIDGQYESSAVCYNQYLYDYFSESKIKSTLFDYEEPIAVGISLCENLVARTGSVVISSAQGLGKQLMQFPPVFIIVAFTSQVVSDLQSSFQKLFIRYKQSLPKTVLALTPAEFFFEGVKDFFVFLIEDIEF